MILGLGAGWQEREHRLFGHELGDILTRMQRLEEGLEVITRLLRSDEPVSFEGRFFRPDGAILLPRPQRSGGPPILIGGNGPQRTLPLVARYANIWNATFLPPQTFRERSAQLDALLKTARHQPTDVRRTMMLSLFFGRDEQELERRLAWRSRDSDLANLSLAQAAEKIAASGRALVGGPTESLEFPDCLAGKPALAALSALHHLSHVALSAPIYFGTPLENYLREIAVDCRAPMTLASLLGLPMLKRGRGGILLMSSLGDSQGSALLLNYTATKAYNRLLALPRKSTIKLMGRVTRRMYEKWLWLHPRPGARCGRWPRWRAYWPARRSGTWTPRCLCP